MCMISYIHDSTSVSSTTSMTVPVPDLQHQRLYLCQIYNINDCTCARFTTYMTVRTSVWLTTYWETLSWRIQPKYRLDEKSEKGQRKNFKNATPPKKYQKKNLHKNKQIIYNFSLLMRSIHEFIDLWEYIDLILILGLIIDWSQKTSIVWL